MSDTFDIEYVSERVIVTVVLRQATPSRTGVTLPRQEAVLKFT